VFGNLSRANDRDKGKYNMVIRLLKKGGTTAWGRGSRALFFQEIIGPRSQKLDLSFLQELEKTMIRKRE